MPCSISPAAARFRAVSRSHDAPCQPARMTVREPTSQSTTPAGSKGTARRAKAPFMESLGTSGRANRVRTWRRPRVRGVSDRPDPPGSRGARTRSLSLSLTKSTGREVEEGRPGGGTRGSEPTMRPPALAKHQSGHSRLTHRPRSRRGPRSSRRGSPCPARPPRRGARRSPTGTFPACRIGSHRTRQ